MRIIQPQKQMGRWCFCSKFVDRVFSEVGTAPHKSGLITACWQLRVFVAAPGPGLRLVKPISFSLKSLHSGQGIVFIEKREGKWLRGDILILENNIETPSQQCVSMGLVLLAVPKAQHTNILIFFHHL